MRLEGLRTSGQRIWERLEDTFSMTVRRSEVRSVSVHNRQSELGETGPNSTITGPSQRKVPKDGA